MAIPKGAVLLGLGLLSALGCSPPGAAPAAPSLLVEWERPRDDFSRRTIAQDDDRPVPAEEPKICFPEATQSDG